MSSDGRTVGPSDRNTPAPSASVHPTRPTVRPTVRLSDLGSIAHPPDATSVASSDAFFVIAHQHRAIRQDQQANRTSPAGAVGKLPAGHEVLHRRGETVRHAHAHDLGARRYGTVPGAVIRHERVAAILRWERRARIEHEPERRRVRLHGDRRRLHRGAVGSRILRVALPGKIAPRPAVPLAVLENVHVFRRNVVASPNGWSRPVSTVTTDSATPSPSASTRRAICPAPWRATYTAPSGPSARLRGAGMRWAKRLTVKPPGTYNAWPAIGIVSTPWGGGGGGGEGGGVWTAERSWHARTKSASNASRVMTHLLRTRYPALRRTFAYRPLPSAYTPASALAPGGMVSRLLRA